MIPTKDQFLAAISKTERLVPAPRMLARATQLLRTPESDLGDISELISRDSALVIDVLRCANSAYYALGWRVSAVSEAVQIIGFRETIRLLNLVAAHQTTNRDLGSYGIAAEDFWAESLFSGLFLNGLRRQLLSSIQARPTRSACCGSLAGSRSTRSSTTSVADCFGTATRRSRSGNWKM